MQPCQPGNIDTTISGSGALHTRLQEVCRSGSAFVGHQKLHYKRDVYLSCADDAVLVKHACSCDQRSSAMQFLPGLLMLHVC